MLMKSARSHLKDEQMNQLIDSSDIQRQKHKIHALFVGFSLDTDSVRSPTSPLDFKIFSSFGNPFRHHSRTHTEWKNKSWNCEKMGLGIICSLKDETNEPAYKNSILLERNLSVRSLDVCSQANLQEALSATFFREKQQISAEVLENADSTGSFPTVFGSRNSGFGSGHTKDLDLVVPSESHESQNIGPFRVGEMEHSEDYSCVRTHCPNPKVTHIFGECHHGEVTSFLEASEPPNFLGPYPSTSFLKLCYSCTKQLDGEDIYMYRGERAFCSIACRAEEIELEEEMEKANHDSFETPEVTPKGPGITSESLFFIST